MNNLKKNKGENGSGGHITISVRAGNIIFLPGAYSISLLNSQKAF